MANAVHLFITVYLFTALSISAMPVIGDSTSYDLDLVALEAQVSYERIAMYDKWKPMGLSGLHLTVGVKPWLNIGVASFGAVTGNQGGLFTLGIETNLRWALTSKITMAGGAYWGGGGGNVGTGNGSFYRYQIGLHYKIKKLQLGLNFTDMEFPDSEVSGSQAGLAISIPTTLIFGSPAYLNHNNINSSQLRLQTAQKLGITKFHLNLVHQHYFQRQGTRSVDGVIQDDPIRLIGFEIRQEHTEKIYSQIKTSGAYAGIRHGYMDILLGIGHRYSLVRDRLSGFAEVQIGAGGGARVETGGGFLAGLNAGIQFSILRDLWLGTNIGYLIAPGGELSSITSSLQIGSNMNLASISNTNDTTGESVYHFRGWTIRLSNQIYQKPDRLNMAINDNIGLVGLKIDYLVNPFSYITGQGYFAYSGERAGGLAIGLLGAGIQTGLVSPLNIRLNHELLLGAAGGGHLELGEGAIVQPMIGISANLSPFWGIQVSWGKVFALTHDLNNPVLEINIITSFTTLFKKLKPA